MREKLFTEIYKNNGFGGNQSKSGSGSDSPQTRKIVQELPILLQRLGISSLIDAPCGDLFWIKEVLEKVPILYLGIDIVPQLIERNKKSLSLNRINFKKLDIITEKLTDTADIILCRDLLVHLTFEEIQKVLINFYQTGSKYLLCTTFTKLQINIDIRPDIFSWRPLNLEKSPFIFPSPIEIINEGCSENNGNYSDKSLGLWELATLGNLIKQGIE